MKKNLPHQSCAAEQSASAAEGPTVARHVLSSGAVGEDAVASACCCASITTESSADGAVDPFTCRFVTGSVSTPAGPVPQLSTGLDFRDQLGRLRARFGIRRNSYSVPVGLYAIGAADLDSPVLVTANYKLSFDHLRRECGGRNLWVLVVDTRGINVWCAAGKGIFSAAAVAVQVEKYRLAEVVRHRQLILPQFAAVGVTARDLKKATGFAVVWGPIRAGHLPAFLDAGNKAAPAMRQLSFSLLERLVLVPVEVILILRPVAYFFVAMSLLSLLSGFGPGLYSLSLAFSRVGVLLVFTLAGVFAGACLVPLLLQWLPGRAFALKGIYSGLLVVAFVYSFLTGLLPGEAIGGGLFALAIASYAAMNFTGATPFTSPTGVEREMRRYMPLQFLALAAGVVLWVMAPFR